MTPFKPQVYMDRSNRSCIAVGTDIGGVEIVSLNGDGLGFTVVPDAAFAETWTASDYDLDKALERYAAHIKSRENNHPDAVARIQGLIDSRKGDAASPSELDLPLDTPVETKPAAAAPVVEPEPAAAAEEVKANDPASPAAQEISSAAPEAVPAEVPVSPSVTIEKEVPMNDLNLNQAPAAGEAPAPTTEPAAPAPVAPVAVQAAPAPQAKIAAESLDEGVDANYSVTVNGGSVTVAMGAAKPRRLDEQAYANREQVVVNQPKEPKFVVATDQNGVLARVISMDDSDRKVSGALIGGWIADGYTVTTVTLKDLAKLVGAARKVYEPKKVAGAEPAGDGNE